MENNKNQYDEVKQQEGDSWYGKEMRLGEEDGIPIYTITNNAVLPNIIRPSDAYIKTIALGLTETYCFTDKEIVDYLLDKKGIKAILQKDELLKIVTSALKHQIVILKNRE